MLTVRSMLGELRQRSLTLYWLGWGHFALAAVLLLAMPFDDGVLLGIDRFVKPFKFAVSIGIYVWTFAWFADYLRSSKLARFLCRAVAVTMILEIAPITVQPLRGTVSHFNFDGGFGSLIYGLMGLVIAINTVWAVVLLFGLCSAVKPQIEPVYLLGVRLGIVLFLVGSAVGGALVLNNGHTVGAGDGGPGLPVVNWSTEAGDLRVAHAIGLHALQAVPLFAFLMASRQIGRRSARLTVIAFAAVYGAVTVAAYLQASAGIPLLG